jgi:hypothetical protein
MCSTPQTIERNKEPKIQRASSLRRLSQKSFSERYTEVSAQFEAEALRLAPVGQVTLLNEEKKPARATATNCLRSDPCQGSYGPLALTG